MNYDGAQVNGEPDETCEQEQPNSPGMDLTICSDKQLEAVHGFVDQYEVFEDYVASTIEL